MDKNLVLIKLSTLYKEYLAYKEYFENFLEGMDERKKEVAGRIAQKDFEKELEEFVLDSFVMKNVHQNDIDILVDRILTYFNAARLMGFEKEVDENIVELVKRYKEREFKPRFIIDKGKPIEVVEGFIEEQRRQIRDQGNLSKLIERLSK